MMTKSKEQEALDHARYTTNTNRLKAIVQPLSTARYECDVHWPYINTHLQGWADDYGSVELCPDFQRGHVWTKDQQVHFIENCLRGVVSSSGFVLQFNCPNWEDDNTESLLPHGFQCIDGLQRLIAVQEFLKGNVKPFGLSPEELAFSAFNLKNTYRFRVAVHTFQNKKDLLNHYLAINTGGTPHSEQEIMRVKALRDGLK